MESQIRTLYRIETIEASLHAAPMPEASELVQELDGLITRLPVSLRQQYEWLRTWTRYPIARLRQGACTGCGARYDRQHAFLHAHEQQVTYCEHCLRILLLNDLELVA
jgi:predicted  nucleic acid-binding Zn-ribbon protein